MVSPYSPAWQLACKQLRANGDVESSTLMHALQRNGSAPVPPEILRYLAKREAGMIKKKRGRPAVIDERDELAAYLYEKYSNRLMAAKRRSRRAKAIHKPVSQRRPNKPLRDKGTPSKRAAEFVVKVMNTRLEGRNSYYPPIDYRSVVNIASKVKSKAEAEIASGTHRPYWRTLFPNPSP